VGNEYSPGQREYGRRQQILFLPVNPPSQAKEDTTQHDAKPTAIFVWARATDKILALLSMIRFMSCTRGSQAPLHASP